MRYFPEASVTLYTDIEDLAAKDVGMHIESVKPADIFNATHDRFG